MLSDGFEIWRAAWKGQPLGALFDKKDGQSIVDVLEIGPFGNPFCGVWVFWEGPRET